MFKKNTAVTGFPFGLVNSSGSAITSGTVTGYYTLDGGTQGTITGTPVHEGNGQWTVNLLPAEMNGDVVGLVFTHASAVNAYFTIKTTTKLVTDLNDIAATDIVSSGAITTSSGSVSNVTTTTNLTNLPAITAGWLTAAGIAASALDGKGDWNIGKTGYSLTQTFPTNFSDMSISATTGLVDITQTAADKVWSTTTRILTAGTNIVLAKGTGLTGLNDIAATDIVTNGAITTLSGAVVNVDTVDTLTTYTGNTPQTADHTADIAILKSGIITGSAQTGTLSVSTITTDLTGYTAEQLVGRTITFTSGAADGESTIITAYAVTNGQISFTGDFVLTVAPANTDTFKIT